ncbi:MAG: hypothetical protein Q4F88_03875 [Eubacteriales bacterium]|nr:hypothetical protein [Eubacteriales bacterium]
MKKTKNYIIGLTALIFAICLVSNFENFAATNETKEERKLQKNEYKINTQTTFEKETFDENNTLSKDQEIKTTSITISDIKVGDMVRIVLDTNGDASKIFLMSNNQGPKNNDNMPKQNENKANGGNDNGASREQNDFTKNPPPPRREATPSNIGRFNNGFDSFEMCRVSSITSTKIEIEK